MSANLYDEYKTNENAENDGTWIEFRGDLKLKIRSDTSMRVREWANKRAKRQRQIIVANAGMLPPLIEDRNEIDICAEVLIVDWQGATDASGATLPYSIDAVRALMKDLPGLRREVMVVSKTEEVFRDGGLDAMGKTSATPSRPTSE